MSMKRDDMIRAAGALYVLQRALGAAEDALGDAAYWNDALKGLSDELVTLAGGLEEIRSGLLKAIGEMKGN